MNFFDDWEAAPIKKPSNSLIVENILIFLSFTDPPYNIKLDLLLLKFFFNSFLIKVNILVSSVVVGIIPVRMDQRG